MTTVTKDTIVHSEPVMGTVVSFRVYPGACSDAAARAAVESSCRRLHELDGLFSTWNPESPMSLLRSDQLGLDGVPPEIPRVIEARAPGLVPAVVGAIQYRRRGVELAYPGLGEFGEPRALVS